jgi:nudix-type nucleoside diphosphatase (YffH/AdpP family)
MASHIFLAGLAAEGAVLRAVLGEMAAQPAHIAGLTLVEATAGPWPVAVRQTGAAAAGVVVQLSPDQRNRLDFALRALAMTPDDLPDDGGVTYLGQGCEPMFGTDAAVLAVVLAFLEDILPLQGMGQPPNPARRLGPALVRAASRVRARAPAPSALRHNMAVGDLHQQAWRQPYAQFFAVEEYDLSWRRFDGSFSQTATRAAFISGDAVTVLPYDPQRDRVLVIEQFRAGPLARGDAQCWQIEAIAGRVDPFETPEDAARREAVEEAGLILTDLLPVGTYYPSPGAKSEFLYSYLALTDLPDGCAGVFGVADEVEDIRGHLISFDRLMDLVTSGEIATAPLILTALWLQRERARLMQGR